MAATRLAPLFGTLPFAMPAHAAPAGGVIDMHCHVFNASDLPIYGFLRQAIFGLYDAQVQLAVDGTIMGTSGQTCDAHAGLPWYFTRGMAEALASLLNSIMQANAITASEEVALLARPQIASSPEPDERTVVGRALFDFFRPNRPSTPLDETPPPSVDPEYWPKIAQDIEDGREPLKEALLKELRTPRSSSDAFSSIQASEDTAHEACGGTGFISRNLCWARRLTAKRSDLADLIDRTYGGNDGLVRLFTPALVDYSKWLNDEPKSDLRSQVKVMEQISIRAGRAKFHGFVAFDPLRAAHEGASVLGLAREAVESCGFLGVKLYPPMGFKPLNNATDPTLTLSRGALKRADNQPPFTPLQLAAAMDQNLDRLYDWCAKEGVPILTHAADSYGSGPCYSRRAKPSNWLPVVSKYPGIRLCLAHFGGFDSAVDPSTKRLNLNKLETTWEWSFGKVLSDPGGSMVFGDISYFSDVLKDSSSDLEILSEAFARLLRAFPVMSDRLIYGSDWILLNREAGQEKHLTAVRGFMSKVFSKLYSDPAEINAKLEGVFLKNAIRFLGINPSGKAAQRLVAFYQRNGMEATFLQEFAI
jgi:predicted TIM-barrel fold metal-dependent hydrolase